MKYRKLVLGLSVVGLMILAGTALAQKSKKPKAVIRTAPAASAPAPVAPTLEPRHAEASDAYDPVEFKPAPMDVYETASSPQIVYPHSGVPVPTIYPSPAYAPHAGMATRVAVDETSAPPSLPALPHHQSMPCPVVQFPTVVPDGAPYTPPGYAYPAPPAFHTPGMPPHPHYIVSPRPLTKSELLRGALCHLEAAGAEELVKLVHIEVATEEKRELTEELAQKEVELQALKSDIDRLRAHVDETNDTTSGEPKEESKDATKPASPQVNVKVRVLELDLAKIKAAGIELPPCANPGQCAQSAVACPLTGAQPPKPQGVAEWMSRKTTVAVTVSEPSNMCFVDCQDSLDKFFQVLGEAKAMRVLAEPCVMAPSGKRTRFCCAGGATTHVHSDVETCDYCAADSLELDLLATVLDDNQIQTQLAVRHHKSIVLPANTTGLEGALPPSIQVTGLETGFVSKSGRTFVTTLKRKSCCTEETDADKTDSDEAVDATPKSKEVICMILVTPCLADEAKCSDEPKKCSCESSCDKCTPSECPPFETTTADGIRLRMMREPFLNDVQVQQEVESGEFVLGGVRPRIVEVYCAKCQREIDATKKQETCNGPAGNGNEQLLKANFHYYRPGDKSTDLTPLHWGVYPPPRPFKISGIELSR